MRRYIIAIVLSLIISPAIHSQDNLLWEETLGEDSKVFRKPSYFSAPINSFKGEKVKIVGYTNGFIKVTMEGDEFGYVYIDYVPNGRKYGSTIMERIENEMHNKPGLYFSVVEINSKNTSDGIDILLQFGYNGDKTIKYIHMDIAPYNRVGDPVLDDISQSKLIKYSLTGPLDKVDLSEFVSDALFYSKTASCIELKKVEIEFMDGTKKLYIKDLPEVMLSNMVNDCGY